jgi:hypothetical protein
LPRNELSTIQEEDEIIINPKLLEIKSPPPITAKSDRFSVNVIPEDIQALMDHINNN